MTEPTKTRRPRKMARPAAEPAQATEVQSSATSGSVELEAAPDRAELAASPQPQPPQPKPVSKIAQVLELLRRSDGATLAQLVDATGWLPHTTRAALTGLKKKGHAITKTKRDGVTCYAIVPTAGE
jgi:hypothetical protein